jgi:hypothetical protein
MYLINFIFFIVLNKYFNFIIIIIKYKIKLNYIK